MDVELLLIHVILKPLPNNIIPIILTRKMLQRLVLLRIHPPNLVQVINLIQPRPVVSEFGGAGALGLADLLPLLALFGLLSRQLRCLLLRHVGRSLELLLHLGELFGVLPNVNHFGLKGIIQLLDLLLHLRPLLLALQLLQGLDVVLGAPLEEGDGVAEHAPLQPLVQQVGDQGHDGVRSVLLLVNAVQLEEEPLHVLVVLVFGLFCHG